MKQTEQYVRQATRGLWGRARHELRMELEGHIAERCQEFRLAGLSAAEAERQTLRELGAPAQVSGGMLDVHTFPALGKAGVLSALLATAVFSALPQGLAQVQSIYSQTEKYGPASYLDFEQLKETFRKAGGEVSGPASNPTITIPSAPRAGFPLNTAQWPGTTLVQNGKTFLRTDNLIGGLLSTGADIRLSGWNNPTISAGQTRLTLETNDWRILNDLYFHTLSFSGPQLNAGATLSALDADKANGKASFTGAFEPGGIYALITATFGYWSSKSQGGELLDSGNIILTGSINQAKAGQIEFKAYDNDTSYKIFSSINEFQLALDPYRGMFKSPQRDAKRPVPILILKLNGHFGPDAYTVVSPASVKK